jgi:hypothetical protein
MGARCCPRSKALPLASGFPRKEVRRTDDLCCPDFGQPSSAILAAQGQQGTKISPFLRGGRSALAITNCRQLKAALSNPRVDIRICSTNRLVECFRLSFLVHSRAGSLLFTSLVASILGCHLAAWSISILFTNWESRGKGARADDAVRLRKRTGRLLKAFIGKGGHGCIVLWKWRQW